MPTAKKKATKSVEEDVIEMDTDTPTEMAIADNPADNLPMSIDDEMALEAQALRNNLQITSPKVSTKNKSYTLPDGTMVGDTIQFAILGYAMVNTMYKDESFVDGKPSEVVCQALVDMKVGGDMIPKA